MKRLILLAIVFATTLSLSAQRNMQVWEGDSYSEFFTGNVDSVTFLLSPEGTLRTYATPQFKIENDYWFVSYDEGSHWTQLGKATGEQGPQGEKGEKGDQGEKGDKGDSMFLSVTQDDKFIYLLMSDSTKVQIAKVSPDSGTEGTHADDDIIEFRDFNVKAALLQYTPTIDTNGDGEISYGEAKAVKELKLPYSYYINFGNNSKTVGREIVSFKEFQYFTGIKKFSFNGLTDLVEIILPEGIKYIPEQAFQNTALSSLVIPQGCDSIGEQAFSGCSFLSSIEIPNSVRYIAAWAFRGCPLKSFTFPENYVSGELMFYDYGTSSKEMEMDIIWNAVAYTNPYENGELYTGLCGLIRSSGYMPESKVRIKSIVFGEKVEIIPQYLCFRLTVNEVTIPNSVKKSVLMHSKGVRSLRLLWETV